MPIEIALQQYCDELQFLRNYSKASVRRVRQEVGHLAKTIGAESLQSLTEENIRAYVLNGMAEKGWKPMTLLQKQNAFNIFLKWCIKRKYISENPMDGMAKPKRDRRIPPKLSKSQAIRLLEFVYNLPYRHKLVRYRNHALFAVGLYAGLRRSELFNLKVTDVDLENYTIFVRCGKGKKDRIVPMSYTLARILTEYVKERIKIKATCPEFFVTNSGKEGVKPASFICIVNELRKISGIEFTLHKLRHTFATLMLEGGCDIYSLSKMMGHEDISTTTIYLAASAEHLRGQIGKHPLN